MDMPSVSIIGVGRAGGALALALHRAGSQIEYLVHRDSATAEAVASRIPGTRLRQYNESFSELTSDIILITTPDPAISQVAERLAAEIQHKPIVLHTSGSLSSQVLSGLTGAVSGAGSMHPLVSISDPISGSNNFQSAYFCVEGDESGERLATSLVRSLGGRPFSIPSSQKPLYHASAVMASGHLVALIDMAIEMLGECGMDPESAKNILLPLIRTTVTNLESKSPSQALTGSFARADVDAVERHLAAIGEHLPLIRTVYLALGERSIDLAAVGDVDDDSIRELRKSISIAKRKPE